MNTDQETRDNSPLAAYLESTIPYLGRFRAHIDKREAKYRKQADDRETGMRVDRELIGLYGDAAPIRLINAQRKLVEIHAECERVHANDMRHLNRVQNEDLECEMRCNPDIVARFAAEAHASAQASAQASAAFIKNILS